MALKQPKCMFQCFQTCVLYILPQLLNESSLILKYFCIKQKLKTSEHIIQLTELWYKFLFYFHFFQMPKHTLVYIKFISFQKTMYVSKAEVSMCFYFKTIVTTL